ncbi:MAG: hypothetical protein GY757_61085, partial [bacterium]|nr:hypothetical protein [bacterium]
ILKELCKRITDKDKTEDVRKAIVAANDARPPRYVDEGGNIDPPPGGRFVLTQIGDSSLGIADFGQRGFLRIESIVTGVNPLTIESNVEGTLKDFPEVVLPIRKVEIDFTWLANGRAYGSATYLANTAEGERVNIPVTYSIEYRAEKPSIELPARFAGEMALESYNMETRETSGPINYYQVEYPAKLR